jgi:hypothetical protein
MANHVAETPGMKGCDSLCINCRAKLQCKWMQTRRAIILVQPLGGAPGLSLVSSKLTIWVTTYEPTGQTPNTTQPLNFVFGHLNVTTLKI